MADAAQPDDEENEVLLNGKETLRGVTQEELDCQYKHISNGEEGKAREENFFESIFCFCCPRLSVL